MNFTIYNEQNRRQDNVHRPRTGNPVLLMLMLSDENYNHANPFRNGRGRSQSVSWAIQPVQLIDFSESRYGLKVSEFSYPSIFNFNFQLQVEL